MAHPKPAPPLPPAQYRWRPLQDLTEAEQGFLHNPNLVHNYFYMFSPPRAQALGLAPGTPARLMMVRGDGERLRLWVMMGRFFSMEFNEYVNLWWCCDVQQAYAFTVPRALQP